MSTQFFVVRFAPEIRECQHELGRWWWWWWIPQRG